MSWTGDDVAPLLEATYKLPAYDPFITLAQVYTRKLATLAVYQEEGEAQLDQIGILLTAHFVESLHPRPLSDRIEQSTVSFWGQPGKGLMATWHGQQAVWMDSMLNPDPDLNLAMLNEKVNRQTRRPTVLIAALS